MMPMMGMPPQPEPPMPTEGGMNPLVMLILQMLMQGGEQAPPQMAPPQVAMPAQDPASNPDLALAAGRRMGM